MAVTAELAAGEVHVWVASLDAMAGDLAALGRSLAPEEEQRAAQLRFATDRRRFLARRGVRRAVLAHYVGGVPASLRFQPGPCGKPELVGGGDVRFNCSHSGSIAVVAVTRRRRVGIDVEKVRPVADRLAVARSLFSPAELAALDAAPSGESDELFLRCWTRKEAYLKASGEGLGATPDRFGAGLVSPPRPAGPETVGEDVAAHRWTVRELAPGRGYVGAVAAEGSGWSLRLRPW